ncbi:SagB/ThcOx family dehydrogenase [Vacuolonema iberomarrocanum]|uniref:SagB/ThcOx family dehydrogenase n=1 Tax=Vacuolonema iberomarrocanum TaxID=3454632 RepID=UPI0019DF2EC1|nr:SagB/ThcOx family dehydrogenase [filamentous cyanobacterium LEGE 07170]
MVLAKATDHNYHEATKHSVVSVQIDPNYVDASTQPQSFKTYPHFFRRFPLEPTHPTHQFLALTSAITYQKHYREGTHLLRVQPSAGALYPTELYVQVRGISGMLDGIYHLEPETNSLTLIYELIDDGIEAYFTDAGNDIRLVKGCILLVSCVYFRSSWKYRNRSLRYCFLDSGHHLGAIEASAYASGYDYQLLFDVDWPALNEDFGFETKEFFTAAMVVGEVKARATKKPVRRLRSPIPTVSGTDYFEPNRFIEVGYQATLRAQASADSAVPLQPRLLQQPTFPVQPAQWQEAIQQRRSARRFYPTAISQKSFLAVCDALHQPLPGALKTLEIYAVLHRVDEQSSGLYRTIDDKTLHCLKTGEFHTQTGHLCINQAIARDCAAIFFITSACHNYRVSLQQAGVVGHRIYLAATALGLGCSGIGAFYDDEVQAFLGTDQPVLYAIAVGQTTRPDLIT